MERSALELGRTHLTIDLLVTFAVTLDVALVDDELIVEVSRRLRL